MKILFCFGLLLFCLQPSNAQKYNRTNDMYSFNYVDGKLNLSFNESVIGSKGADFTADQEIIMFFDKWLGAWTPIVDGKIGDSLVDFTQYPYILRGAISFYRKGDFLYISENIRIEEEVIYTIDPATGSDMELVDENGNNIYRQRAYGGYFELYSLKENKSILQKEYNSITKFYGNKVLTYNVSYDANDDQSITYSLYDETGQVVFQEKDMSSIYASDELLSNLVSKGKAEKIIRKDESLFTEHFLFIQNGKMGISSIGYGVKSEPIHDFIFQGSVLYYSDNGNLFAKKTGMNLSAEKSIQMNFLENEEFKSYYLDDKLYLEPGEEDYGYTAPSFRASESFVKNGDLIVYSEPYKAYYIFDENTNESLLSDYDNSKIIIYDLTKKEIVFNEPNYSLVNFTDKGFLIFKNEKEMKNGFYTGNTVGTISVVDRNGKFIHKNILESEFNQKTDYWMSLLPEGSKAVKMDNSLYGIAVIYCLNGKVGALGNFKKASRVPDMKWYITNFQSYYAFYQDKLVMDDSVINFTGEKPFCIKNLFNAPFSYFQIGNEKASVDYNYNRTVFTEPIMFNLTDTSYKIHSVEFKKNLVIQNNSDMVRGMLRLNYDEMGNEILDMTANGDTLVNVYMLAESGIFDLATGNWLVPAEFFRVIPTDKYYVASVYPKLEKPVITKKEFRSFASKISFVVYDKKGKMIVKGNAGEVMKKTKLDVKALEYKY